MNSWIIQVIFPRLIVIILKCHIERVDFLSFQGGDCNEKNIRGKLTLREASYALHLSYRQDLEA
jgi:hypothetical protein